MGLLDQPDDLQLFGSRIPHSSFLASPIPDHAFFEQAQFQGLLGDDLLQRLGFPAQVFDLAAGCRSRCVACKAPFSGLQELLRPSVIQELRVSYGKMTRIGRGGKGSIW